jgi:hypothetical protein
MWALERSVGVWRWYEGYKGIGMRWCRVCSVVIAHNSELCGDLVIEGWTCVLNFAVIWISGLQKMGEEGKDKLAWTKKCFLFFLFYFPSFHIHNPHYLSTSNTNSSPESLTRMTGTVAPFDSVCPSTQTLPRRDWGTFLPREQRRINVDLYNGTNGETRKRISWNSMGTMMAPTMWLVNLLQLWNPLAPTHLPPMVICQSVKWKGVPWRSRSTK